MTQLGNPRPPTHWQDRFRMTYDLPSETSDTTVKLLKVKGRSIAVERVMLNLPAGLAASGTDYVNYKLLKGASTVAFNWSTQTGHEGTITADTPVELVITVTPHNAVFDDGDIMSLFIDTTGSPTSPAGRLVIEGHEI